jgi:hypothetical protein
LKLSWPEIYAVNLCGSQVGWIAGRVFTLGGIAGPQINYDTVVTAKFNSTKGRTTFFLFFAGVVPDDTFPGDLTISNSVFHKWRISFDGDVKLRSFDGKPVLVPCDRVPKAYFAKAAAAKEKLDSNVADAIAMR